jgi:hypothetical protein
VDLFTTLAHVGGAEIPQDRAIDDVDQLPFFVGQQEGSNREGFPACVADQDRGQVPQLEGNLIKQENTYDPPVKLPPPRIINLLTDMKEERDAIATSTWVAQPVVSR